MNIIKEVNFLEFFFFWLGAISLLEDCDKEERFKFFIKTICVYD